MIAFTTISVSKISTSVIITLLILNKKKVITLVKTGGFSASFYASIALLTLFLIIGIFVAIDFDTAFKVFHQIFFPGKDNWMFSSKDQISFNHFSDNTPLLANKCSNKK